MDYFTANQMLILGIVLGASLVGTILIAIADVKSEVHRHD